MCVNQGTGIHCKELFSKGKNVFKNLADQSEILNLTKDKEEMKKIVALLADRDYSDGWTLVKAAKNIKL